MSPSPTLSILISIFNSEKTIDKCFQSIADQSFQDFSIVCINDASTDTSSQILKKWRQFFGDRLLLIENEINLGLTKSLNLGLQSITTPYTARIDSDDWWEPSKLTQQLSFLETHPEHGMVGTNYINHFTTKEIPIILPQTDTAIKKSIFKRNPFAHSAVLFRTGLVKSLGGYDDNIRYGQDYDLWLRLLPKTRFANLSTFLCHRNAIDTLSSQKQRKQMLQCVKIQLKYLKLYRRSFLEYRFILEPLLVALTPTWIRSFKRKLFL